MLLWVGRGARVRREERVSARAEPSGMDKLARAVDDLIVMAARVL
jgi:hypothetical protein